MPNIATLTVTLAADSARYVSELSKASRKSKTFAGSVQKAVRVGARATAAAGTAAVGALTAVSISAARSADQLAKTSDKLGIATEKLAALQLAGRLTGVQNEKLNMGLQRMTRRIAEAAVGTGEAQGALKELGIDAKEISKLPLDQQFQMIAGAMQGVSSQSDKVRLGFKLFDSEGVDLIRTLDTVGKNFGEIERQATLFGVALTRVEAAQIEMAGDALERAKTATEGLGTNIAIAVAPLIEQIAGGFADAALEAEGFKGEVQGAMEGLVVGANFAANSVRGVQVALLGAKLALLQLRRPADKQPEGSLAGMGDELSGAAARERALQGKFGAKAVPTAADVDAEIDATGSAIDALLGKFQTADQALAKFREKQAEAVAAARERVSTQSEETIEEVLFGEDFEERMKERDERLLLMFEDTAKRMIEVEKQKQEEINRAVLRGIHTREQFEAASRKTQVKGVLGTLESITAGVATHSKGLFRLNQAAAIANAVINTSEAVTKALSAYPPPLSFAMAGAQAAAGAVQIAAIRSATFGGGTTPSVAGSVPTLEGQPVQQPQPIDSEPKMITEVHVHGDVLTEDRLERVLGNMFDSDRVIMRGSSRQAASIRSGANRNSKVTTVGRIR